MSPSRLIAAAAVLALVLAAAVPSPAWAQTPPPPRSDDAALGAIRSELDRMREELAAMRSELRALREFLQRLAAGQGPRATATVTTGDNPALGRRDAPVTIVEFSDYECPFCRQFVTATLPTLKSTYVDAGKVRWVFRDFPLEQLHPHARKAAEAAHCAGEQGKYWEMHDVLFSNQQALAADQLPGYAGRLGLDAARFTACLDSGKYADAIQQNLGDGAAAGVRGTPSFVIGRTRPDGSVEGLLVSGARPLPEFRQEIDRLLSEK
jgi:protein-disulfide isomerase